MKVIINDDKIIVYLYKENIDINNIDDINKFVKQLIIKLIKRYELNFYGLSKVTIYHNKYYGNIFVIEKIYHSAYNYNVIDLKIIVYKDVPLFFEFEDCYFDTIPKNMQYDNGRYYLDINSVDDINKYIEYGKIIFKKFINEID